MQYWLVKSEPDCFSIQDLKREKVSSWSGVRNYAARNNLRAMKRRDLLLFHHSSCAVPAIVGVAVVVKEAYVDPTQFVVSDDHFDAKSTKENPRWSTVDVSLVEIFELPLTLSEIKQDKRFAGMELVKQGSRLSVQPVAKTEFTLVMQLRSAQGLS